MARVSITNIFQNGAYSCSTTLAPCPLSVYCHMKTILKVRVITSTGLSDGYQSPGGYLSPPGYLSPVSPGFQSPNGYASDVDYSRVGSSEDELRMMRITRGRSLPSVVQQKVKGTAVAGKAIHKGAQVSCHSCLTAPG